MVQIIFMAFPWFQGCGSLYTQRIMFEVLKCIIGNDILLHQVIGNEVDQPLV